MSGGYVGVDVFFMISGYLITSLILKDLRAGSFCIRESPVCPRLSCD
jgi:peptidoglycan/LPS O-acetylase OafA/YrhL